MPDFAGTIHSYTGESLETGIVDCLAVEDTPRAEDQWKAYIGLSRLTSADGLLVAQPFAPMLFRQGPLLGPTLLMQFQRGEISVEQVCAAWKQSTKRKKNSFAFKDVKWPCGRCGVEKKAEHFAPQKNDLKHFAMDTLLVRGAWRCCLSCHAQASPAPADKRWCDVCNVFLSTACFLSTEERNICFKHLKTFQQQRMQPVKCSRCGQKREATEYHTPTLKNLQQEDRLHEAVCLHCAPQHIPKGWEEKKTTCCVCLEELQFK